MKEKALPVPKHTATPCELARGFHDAMVTGFMQGITRVIMSEAAPEMAWLQAHGHALPPAPDKLSPRTKRTSVELKQNTPVILVHDMNDHI